MKIYFAGSIRGGREDKELYLEIIRLLGEFGEVLTEHIGDQTLSTMGEDGPSEKYIYNRDMNWLRDSDVIVAEVTTPSLGVGYEVGIAESLKKPTLCLYREIDGRSLSAMVAGNPHLTVKTYKNLEDVKSVLQNFFKK